MKSEEIYLKMDDEDKEEEMMDQRDRLAESLNINIDWAHHLIIFNNVIFL